MDNLLTRPSTAENLIKLPALPKFIEHKIASAETESVTAVMYEYLMAAGGVFILAKRREFTACLPLCEKKINSLPEVTSGIIWHKPKISSLLWFQTRADFSTEQLNQLPH